MILEKSIKNCHVKGLHSIVLSEGLGGRLKRMYIHEPEGGLAVGGLIPLAVHAHRRDLKIKVLAGRLSNLCFKFDAVSGFEVPRWKWNSPILGKSGGFERSGSVKFAHNPVVSIHTEGSEFFLLADWLHTVDCSFGEWTAWIVSEGRFDPKYEPWAYSMADLSNLDMSELYQPFKSSKEIRDLVRTAGIHGVMNGK